MKVDKYGIVLFALVFMLSGSKAFSDETEFSQEEIEIIVLFNILDELDMLEEDLEFLNDFDYIGETNE